MSGLAVRVSGYAGVLAAGLLISGMGSGIAIADPGESNGQNAESAGAASATESTSEGSAGSGAASDNNPTDDRPTSTVGSGREDDVRPPSEPEEAKTPEPERVSTLKPRFRNSITIAIPRIPKPEEMWPMGWGDARTYFSTVAIPVPTIDDFLYAPQPQPSPTPGPAFRIQEEPPVIDAGPVDIATPAAADHSELPVIQSPLVIAPPVAAAAVSPPRTPLGTSAGRLAPLPQTAGVQEVTTAGTNAPVIRGSLPLRPAAEPKTAESMTPMAGQATRLGYPRYLRNPTVGELAAIALPGVAGLLVFTMSGSIIGYRQANSLRFIRTADAARFLE